MKRKPPLQVWKFGGASLADAAAVRHAVELIRAHDGPLVVVASALAGVTDLLLDGAKRSVAGDPEAAAQTAAFFLRRHRDLAQALVKGSGARHDLLHTLDAAAREYREIAHAMAALGDLSPRASDTLVARGERASSALVAAVLRATGRRAERVDAVDFLATDARHGGAAPDLALTRRKARARLLPLLRRGLAPVVPGFIGRAPDGSVTTLGRGGSDLTATLLGRVLGAERVVLWKDVPGILTADPKAVPDARLVPQLHHREAAEVAYFGAKVLHPRALIPLDGSRISLHVRSFVEPTRPGTEISARRIPPGHPVKALATIKGQALVTVAGKGLMGVPGVAARTFSALHAEKLSVSTIFQASSESSIGFTLPEGEAARAVAALRRAFRDDIAAGLVDGVTARHGVAVLAVVGDGMAGTPGIAARVFSSLAEARVNVMAIAQGSSELNISFAVAATMAGEAARAVHAAFQLSKIDGSRSLERAHADVVLLGFGRVGRALAAQIAAQAGRSPVRLVGLVDRTGFVFDPAGLDARAVSRLAQGKERGRLLADLGGERGEAAAALRFIAGHAVSRPVLVDVTADETAELLHLALGLGYDLVLANKKPLAGPAASHARLLAAVKAAGRRLRFEATVGAGLPVLDTCRKLQESGDRILKIEGAVSGTLGFVLSAVSNGRPFSEAVGAALRLGYTEPDPRDDLSGKDVARKGLILARQLGYTGSALVAEDLTPRPLRGLSVAVFLKRLPEADAEWRRRSEAARARGRVLRYGVTATARGVRAGLLEAPLDSPLGALTGTRNLVAFTTARYREEPLVVAGPGAGAAVTASGILSDIQALAGIR